MHRLRLNDIIIAFRRRAYVLSWSRTFMYVPCDKSTPLRITRFRFSLARTERRQSEKKIEKLGYIPRCFKKTV